MKFIALLTPADADMDEMMMTLYSFGYIFFWNLNVWIMGPECKLNNQTLSTSKSDCGTVH